MLFCGYYGIAVTMRLQSPCNLITMRLPCDYGSHAIYIFHITMLLAWRCGYHAIYDYHAILLPCGYHAFTVTMQHFLHYHAFSAVLFPFKALNTSVYVLERGP